MTWVKVDDLMPEHPRWDKLGAAGLGLHLAAVAYCSRNLTDGLLSLDRAKRLITCPEVDAVVELLIADGLWVEVPPDQVRISDYLVDQPTAEAVTRQREVWKAKQRRNRSHKEGDHSLCTRGRFCPTGGLVSGRHSGESDGESQHPVPVPVRDKGTRGADAQPPRGSAAVAPKKRAPRAPAPSARQQLEARWPEAVAAGLPAVYAWLSEYARLGSASGYDDLRAWLDGDGSAVADLDRFGTPGTFGKNGNVLAAVWATVILRRQPDWTFEDVLAAGIDMAKAGQPTDRAFAAIYLLADTGMAPQAAVTILTNPRAAAAGGPAAVALADLDAHLDRWRQIAAQHLGETDAA